MTYVGELTHWVNVNGNAPIRGSLTNLEVKFLVHTLCRSLADPGSRGSGTINAGQLRTSAGGETGDTRPMISLLITGFAWFVPLWLTLKVEFYTA